MKSQAGLTASLKPARRGILFAFLAFASWGLLSPVGKHLLDMPAYEPLGLNFVRFALATVALLAILGPAVTRQSLRLAARGNILWPNLLANLSLTLFLYSLELLAEPTQATLGFYAAPLFTAMLAHWMLGERAGPWFLPATAGLLGGGYVALFGLSAPASGFSALGMGLAVASAIVWAYYTVALRKAAPDVELKPLLGASFVIGTVWYGVLALALEGPPAVLQQSAESWTWMAIYVLVPTLASFILFNASLQLAPAGTVNLLVGAELAFTALFAALLFGDRFTVVQVLGLVVVLASVTLYLWERSRAEAAALQGPV